MLDKIRQFFDTHLACSDTEPEASRSARRNLAAAALMVELMHTDDRLDEREKAAFLQVLKDSFGLEDTALERMRTLATEEAREATSLYQFTRLINDLYDYEEKVELIRNLWRIAFADEELDKYEESMIRSVADLIYVSHSDFIRTKLEVRPE